MCSRRSRTPSRSVQVQLPSATGQSTAPRGVGSPRARTESGASNLALRLSGAAVPRGSSRRPRTTPVGKSRIARGSPPAIPATGAPQKPSTSGVTSTPQGAGAASPPPRPPLRHHLPPLVRQQLRPVAAHLGQVAAAGGIRPAAGVRDHRPRRPAGDRGTVEGDWARTGRSGSDAAPALVVPNPSRTRDPRTRSPRGRNGPQHPPRRRGRPGPTPPAPPFPARSGPASTHSGVQFGG